MALPRGCWARAHFPNCCAGLVHLHGTSGPSMLPAVAPESALAMRQHPVCVLLAVRLGPRHSCASPSTRAACQAAGRATARAIATTTATVTARAIWTRPLLPRRVWKRKRQRCAGAHERALAHQLRPGCRRPIADPQDSFQKMCRCWLHQHQARFDAVFCELSRLSSMGSPMSPPRWSCSGNRPPSLPCNLVQILRDASCDSRPCVTLTSPSSLGHRPQGD